MWGITEEERLTIEYRELNTIPPAGFAPKPIAQFPTPDAAIAEISAGTKRKMLERLYIEYQDLCAYAHGRPIASMSKAVFDGRSPLRQ